MNRKIRQLAAALHGPLRAALRGDELLAGRPRVRAQRDGRQHAGDPPRVLPAARRDHHRRRRRRRPLGPDCPTAASSRTSASTRPASCSPTSPATTRSPSARPSSSAPQNAVLTGQTGRAAHRQPRGHHHRRRRHRRRAHDAARRPPGDGPRGARRTSRLGRHARHRRPAPCWRCTATRPTTRTGSSTPTSTPPASPLEELLEAPGNPLLANAYQERYMPGSTFKVLTTGIALEAGVVSLDSQFERVDRVDATADVQPDPELRRHRTAAATSARCSGAAATSRSPRPLSTSASPE